MAMVRLLMPQLNLKLIGESSMSRLVQNLLNQWSLRLPSLTPPLYLKFLGMFLMVLFLLFNKIDLQGTDAICWDIAIEEEGDSKPSVFELSQQQPEGSIYKPKFALDDATTRKHFVWSLTEVQRPCTRND
jgi:hypothetical protein